MEKTNACRILDQKRINYDLLTKDEVNNNQYFIDNNLIFKTLVTSSSKGEHYVFVIPISAELDLKKAAKSVSEKSIQMIPQKELLPLTGYIHGGCSPIGMKKEFKTVIDIYAEICEEIIVSAGDVNLRLKINPNDLFNVLKNVKYDDLTV